MKQVDLLDHVQYKFALQVAMTQGWLVFSDRNDQCLYAVPATGLTSRILLVFPNAIGRATAGAAFQV